MHTENLLINNEMILNIIYTKSKMATPTHPKNTPLTSLDHPHYFHPEAEPLPHQSQTKTYVHLVLRHSHCWLKAIYKFHQLTSFGIQPRFDKHWDSVFQFQK